MLKFSVKFDDKELYDEVANQKATLKVGFFPDQYYDEIDKPFFSKKAKPNSITLKNPLGKPRRFGKSERIPVAVVALKNEYGVPERNVPPRPFMAYTFDKCIKKWVRIVQDKLPQNLDIKETMEIVGQQAVKDMRYTIEWWQIPPNAPSTIRNKGFNNPLIDTRTMIDSVRMEVE